jgi:hypothetical protein
MLGILSQRSVLRNIDAASERFEDPDWEIDGASEAQLRRSVKNREA